MNEAIYGAYAVHATADAQKIATQFGDDGQRWEDGNGIALVDALGTAGARCWSDRSNSTLRFQLPDGSAIVITDGGWDHGITDDPDPDAVDRRNCTCWSEDGETCREPDNCSCECHDGEPDHYAPEASGNYVDTSSERGVQEFKVNGARYQYRDIGHGEWARHEWDPDNFGGGCFLYAGKVTAPHNATARQLHCAPEVSQ